MGIVRGCDIPENLFYSVEHNTWVLRGSDGVATVGLTAYACALIGTVLACTQKRPGKVVRKEQSCATIETARWVGPVRSPISGEVVAVNEHLAMNPEFINADPYGEGWLVRIDPAFWDEDCEGLVTGADALAAFQAKMAADGYPGA